MNLDVARTPEQVRAAVRTALREAGRRDEGDLELAVHEVLANAREHGRPPVDVAVRRVGADVEVVVRDAGPGPAGPVAPPRPVDPAGGDGAAVRGRGRWLAHRLAVVRERRTAEGFEVRLTPRG